MFDNIITFSSHEDYVNFKEDHPIPAKMNVPDWYKKLKHSIDFLTVKGCMPFLDTLTAGYILKLPQDIHVNHNVLNKETNQKDTFVAHGLEDANWFRAKGMNFTTSIQMHPPKQVEGFPGLQKNNNQPVLKFMNPWRIKTPPGYSCLFVPPLNNSDDRFSIIPGIVDTDSFEAEVNFPYLINGDKYKELKTTFEKGTPYVQVIPFKRESWKMKIKPLKTNELHKKNQFYFLKMFNVYKNKFWRKKKWN